MNWRHRVGKPGRITIWQSNRGNRWIGNGYERTWHWSWQCKLPHPNAKYENMPISGGSVAGYLACMKNLRMHMWKYHGGEKPE